MKAYYHNTSASEPHMLLGYISTDGDLITDKEEIDLVGAIGKVYVTRGLWSAGESAEDFKNRVAALARKEFGMLNGAWAVNY